MSSKLLDFTTCNVYIESAHYITLLAPDIIEAILMGEEPSGLSLTMLTKQLPRDWAEQRGELRFSSFTRLETVGSIT